MTNSLGQRLQNFLQVQLFTVSPAERLVSILGGFIAILLVMAISNATLGAAGAAGAALMVTSMGASAVAVVFSIPFAWRRYPVGWAKAPEAAKQPKDPYPDITHADFVVALSEIDTFIDVTEQDLLRIYDLVIKAEQKRESSA